jgi:uncharacterized damage-inducible protein DinB
MTRRAFLCVGLMIMAALTTGQAASSSVLQREILVSFDDAVGKAMQLAKVMPAEKFSWRPAPGVRSAGEVYVHIANGNRLLLTFVGKEPLTQAALMKRIAENEGREKSLAEKDAIINELQGSIDEVRRVAATMTDADLDRPVKFFDSNVTVRTIWVFIVSHASEHLGQSIAYARMNGVTPPWSRSQ